MSYYKEDYTNELAEEMNKIKICENCGIKEEDVKKPYGFPKPLQTHHKIPRSKGGTNDRNNLLRVCPNCHRKLDASESKTEGESK